MLPVYNPHRDYRFEYVHEALDFIEENFCRKGCAHATDGEYPSIGCPFEVDNLLIMERVEVIRDAGNDGLICTGFEG